MRHRAGIQADDLVLHTTQAALPIGHQPRHERAVTIPKGAVQPDWSDIGIHPLVLLVPLREFPDPRPAGSFFS